MSKAISFKATVIFVSKDNQGGTLDNFHAALSKNKVSVTFADNQGDKIPVILYEEIE